VAPPPPLTPTTTIATIVVILVTTTVATRWRFWNYMIYDSQIDSPVKNESVGDRAAE
jgi:hypothetical protein